MNLNQVGLNESQQLQNTLDLINQKIVDIKMKQRKTGDPIMQEALGFSLEAAEKERAHILREMNTLKNNETDGDGNILQNTNITGSSNTSVQSGRDAHIGSINRAPEPDNKDKEPGSGKKIFRTL